MPCKAGNLNSIPGSHVKVEGENRPHKAAQDPYMYPIQKEIHIALLKM